MNNISNKIVVLDGLSEVVEYGGLRIFGMGWPVDDHTAALSQELAAISENGGTVDMVLVHSPPIILF